jgi:hypothetical protein
MSAPFADLPTSTSAALERIQRAIKKTRDARDACVNPTHDHDTTLLTDGTMVGEPVAMYCFDCGRAAHYDTNREDYFHNDPDADPCFLISRPNTDNPCTPKE